jgi:indolepyruvate ferredoxin oxidoreductase beta subunit
MGDGCAPARMSAMRNTRPEATYREPLTLLIAALGGQGGGVLADWIGHAARAEGFVVQATSTPGVSQRTGATTYYLELAPAPKGDAAAPVLALAPIPGGIDVAVCSELLEAARMLERGMITPARTTVIASTHRVYTTSEKMLAEDGRFDTERILGALRQLARRTLLFDMEEMRTRHAAVISAVLFGALAGCDALPLSRATCEGAIRAAGKGVAASLAAFAEAYERATRTALGASEARGATEGSDTADAPLPAPLAHRVAGLPAPVAEFARLGASRATAYQDLAYGKRYLDRVERIVRAEAPVRVSDGAFEVGRETARHLALWMCYEDVIHVASLKGRARRLARIRDDVKAQKRDVVRVYDLFKPSMDEIAAVLPRPLGRWLLRRRTATRARSGGKGIALQASSVSGALALRLSTALRPLRPYSLRFAQEQEAIDDWLAVVEKALAREDGAGSEAALAVARLPRLLKGYGDTHIGTRETFRRMLDAHRTGDGARVAAAEALRAANADALRHSYSPGSAGPTVIEASPRAQPIVWADRRRNL